MRRSPRRWRTSFGRWVGHVGVARLTTELRSLGEPITQKAVYNWLAGERTPRPSSAVAMVRISRGRLALVDVYRHRASIGCAPSEPKP